MALYFELAHNLGADRARQKELAKLCIALANAGQNVVTEGYRSFRLVPTAEAKLIARQSNWASTLMDPCERRLVYQGTQWDKAQPPEPRLQRKS